MIRPKHIRFAKQALLFACIWASFGFIYSLVEYGILGRSTYYPATDNLYDFKTSLIYTILGGFLMGFLHGLIEVLWLEKSFRNRPFWMKIVLKTIFYTIFIIIFLLGLSFSINANRFDAPMWSDTVVESVVQFVRRFAFWSVVFYVAFGMFFALVLSEMSVYMGRNTFLKFIFGKYHSPKRESRIFMFLDMKSSTTIAEQMGHAKFFELLRDYYKDMANAIIETSGEVYQYVGDEIVVTWPEKLGLNRNNCLECFLKIGEALEENRTAYEKKFGVFPTFKAGYHIGMVTTGEIGTIKKEIIYTGDVLNTSARIQAECNNYGVSVLLSEHLMEKFDAITQQNFKEVAQLQLRGKKEFTTLFTLKNHKTNSI